MTVEWRRGDERETILCEDGVFFVGCNYTDATGYHITTMDRDDVFNALCQRSARGFTCRTVERRFPDGATLRLYCLSTADPTIRAIMAPYTGVPQSELSHGDFALTVTV